jgi:SAM-dependent methyltransferase
MIATRDAQRAYAALLDEAAAASAALVASGVEPATPSATAILADARRLLAAHPVAGSGSRPAAGDRAVEEPDGPAVLALRKLVADWPDLAAGRLTGEQAYARDPGLWERLMCEWPMGAYASAAAELVAERDLMHGMVVELGAGVGATSRLLPASDDATFVRTDLNPLLLQRDGLAGAARRYDFDEPAPFRDVDLVVAVNALHCAADPRRTLGHVREALRPGGHLVLGEGSPVTHPSGTPWALNLVFAQFTGWWDRGGFRRRALWREDLEATGFRVVVDARSSAGDHDLGGVLCAVAR